MNERSKSRFRKLCDQAEEKILRDALYLFGSITAAAEYLEIQRNWMSRKLVWFGVTKDELAEYRRRRGRDIWGTGWSGKQSKGNERKGETK